MTYVFLQNLTAADDDIMKYAIGHLALPALVASLSLFLVPLLPFSTFAILSYITLSLPLFFRFSLEGLFPPNLLYSRVAFVSLPDYLSILVCVPMYCLSFCLSESRYLFIYIKLNFLFVRPVVGFSEEASLQKGANFCKAERCQFPSTLW